MARLRWRAGVVAVVASLVLPAFGMAGSPAQASTGPLLGTPLTIKADPSAKLPPVDILDVGDQGLLYQNGWYGAHIFYRAFGAATSVDLGPDGYAAVNTTTSNMLHAVMVGSRIVVPAVDYTGSISGFRVWSLASGTPQIESDHVANPFASTAIPVGFDGGGLLLSEFDWGTGLSRLQRAAFTGSGFGDPVDVGSVTGSVMHVFTDAAGTLVRSSRFDDVAGTDIDYLTYLPVTGPATSVADGVRADTLEGVALSREGIVYGLTGSTTNEDRVHIHWRDGRPPTVLDLSRPVTGLRFAVAGGRLYTGETPTGTDSYADDVDRVTGVLKVQSLTAGAAAADVLGSSTGVLATGPDGSLFTYSAPRVGQQVTSPRLVRIAADGTVGQLGNTLPLLPAQVLEMNLSGGRLVTIDEVTVPKPTYTVRALTIGGGAASVATTSRPWLATAYEQPTDAMPTLRATVVSGSRIARNATPRHGIVATDGVTQTATFAPSLEDSVESLSGKYLLYRRYTSWNPLASNLMLADVSTGAQEALASSNAVVTGGVLYEAAEQNTGTVTTRNLSTGTKGARVLESGCRVDLTAAVSHWIHYSCSTDTTNTTRVLDLDTGSKVTLPDTGYAQLGDGFVGIADSTQSGTDTVTNLSVMDLTDPNHPLVPVATTKGSMEESDGPAWAVDTAGKPAIAYETETSDVVVVPLNITGIGSSVLEQWIPASFVAVTGQTWTPTFKTTSPVTWTLTVRDPATATTLYTASSATASTAVAPVWNGKVGGTGAYVDKAVDYTLTMTPVDGGKAITSTGKVTVYGTYATATVTAPAAFTPDADGAADTWGPTLSATRPATYALSLKDGAGSTRWSAATPTAATAWTAPKWDGKTAGVLNADGTYTWTATIKPSDGFSPVITKTGTVALRARSVTATVKAALYTSDARYDEKVAVSWSSAKPVGITGWNVSYRTVATSSTGTRVYGTTTKWLTNTTATSGTFTGTRGVSYQFLVTPNDTIRPKNATASATTHVTIDDRYLTYSTGWTNQTGSYRYKSTIKSSGTKGRTASYTFYGTGFKLIGDKGTSKGKFSLSIDGASPILVDTYATTTKYRQALYTRALTGGKHTIKITVAGTTGRPTITLDGLGVTH